MLINMCKCVCVSLVLLKGNWQFWKLKASLPGKCRGGKQPSKSMWWCPRMCSVGSPWKQRWGWGSGLHPLEALSVKRVWRGFSKHASSRCPTHLKCVLGSFVWMLASYPSHKMPLDQYLPLYKTWSLNESNACVFTRSNGGEGSTFLHLLHMSHCSFNNSCTVVAQKVAPSEK